MITFLIVLACMIYVLGAYFFLYEERYIGTTSLPIRLLCLLLSPIMVPLLVYEAVVDQIRQSSWKRLK